MTQHLSLVTPLSTFNSHKSSKNLIELLKDLERWSVVIKDVPIEKSLDKVSLDHLNFDEFNNDLWHTLEALDLSIDWWKYSEVEINKEADRIKPALIRNSEVLAYENLTPLGEVAYQSAKEDDDKILESNQSNFLRFFSEINDLLIENKDFARPLKLAQELSEYLKEITFSIEKKESTRNGKNWLTDNAWDCIYPSICQSYAAFLDESEIHSDQNTKEEKIALEFKCLSSWICLSLIAVKKVSPQIFNKPSVDFLNSFKYIRSPFLEILVGIAGGPSATEEKRSRENIELWDSIIQTILVTHSSERYTLSKTYDVVIDSFLENSIETWFTDVEDMVNGPISHLISLLMYEKESEKFDYESLYSFFLVDDGEKESINFKKIREILKSKQSNYLSPEICKKLLNQTSSSNFWEDDQGYWNLQWVSEQLVNFCNKQFKIDGLPYKLNFLSDSEYRTYSKFYESISTIGINLNRVTFSDVFDGTNETERLVTGARTISAAGLTDHSIVFLGYGLLKINLGYSYRNYFSISEVNDFINQPEIAPRIEKLFLPFLRLIMSGEKADITLSNKIWINSILTRYKVADLHLLHFSDSKVDVIRSQNIFLPPWFNKDDEALSNCLVDYRKIQARNEELDPESWRRLCYKFGITRILDEISKSLEASSKDLFKKIYQLNREQQKFQKFLIRVNRNNLKTDRFDLGWIEFFIKCVLEMNKNNPKDVAMLCEIANEFDSSIGKVIYKTKDIHEGALKSFQHFRNIDNLYLSHKLDNKKPSNNIITQSDAKFIFTYATVDFKVIYDLFQ